MEEFIESNLIFNTLPKVQYNYKKIDCKKYCFYGSKRY